jgi:hypothetical protein
MTRKKIVIDSKTCLDCEHGHFGPGEDSGECWRYPRETVVVNDEVEARFSPAFAHEICGEFKRKLQS